MNVSSWTDQENDAVVAAYFSMLIAELCGRPYNKAMYNRTLQTETQRSRGSIEFKLCNTSAVFLAFGLPIIQGYRPRFNFQMSLADAVERWLTLNPSWHDDLVFAIPNGFAEQQSLYVGVAPTLRNAPPSTEDEQLLAVARRFDVAGRDERNRRLGRAGEELVFNHEQQNLRLAGRDDLAKRVRWTARDDGDGAGYDIASYTKEGRDRLIEVKTTTGWERTPFHISRNELDIAEERREAWCLFRLYDFARSPKAFELYPPLEAHVALTATSFRASFQ